jgi:hypothetical protein
MLCLPQESRNNNETKASADDVVVLIRNKRMKECGMALRLMRSKQHGNYHAQKRTRGVNKADTFAVPGRIYRTYSRKKPMSACPGAQDAEHRAVCRMRSGC